MLLLIRFGRSPQVLRRVCRDCESRRAVFRRHGLVTWDPYHTLCFRCHQRLLDRNRTAHPAAGIPTLTAPAEGSTRAVA